MLRTKDEVDRHVKEISRKTVNEQERSMRAFHIAQLYYKVQDFESAQRFASTFLTIRPESQSAHKLLGQCFEALGYKEKAIASFKKALEIDPSQNDLVFKICELLCEDDLNFDCEKAKFWVEKASFLIPYSPVVYKLKEKILTCDSSTNSDEIEDLLQSQLKGRPSDVSVRIKLLKSYIESGKILLAYNHAIDIEQKLDHNSQLAWYKCLKKVYETYHRDYSEKCDWDFYIYYLFALDRLCSLATADSSEMMDLSEAVQAFDKALQSSITFSNRSEELKLFHKAFSYQLPFHYATWLLKKARKDTSLWKDARKSVSPLFLLSSNRGADFSWVSSITDCRKKMFQALQHSTQCRIFQSAVMLAELRKEYHSEKDFLSKVAHYWKTEWKTQLFEKLLKSSEGREPANYYMGSAYAYSSLPQVLICSQDLQPVQYTPSFEVTFLGSLHHMIWMGLQFVSEPGIPQNCSLSPQLQVSRKSQMFTATNLNNTGVETLNQLDIDSFLYSCIFCAGALLDGQQCNGTTASGKPLSVLPPDLTDLLCTPEQSRWWSYAFSSVFKQGMTEGKSKTTEMRQCLQKGIEAVRGSLPLTLLVCLARALVLRAWAEIESEKSRGCEERALHLWKIAVPQLERVIDQSSTYQPRPLNLFDYSMKEFTHKEARQLLDEGRFFIAEFYLKQDQCEKALEEFQLVHTPESYYKQASIYAKLAEEVSSQYRDDLQDGKGQKEALLINKAKELLVRARDHCRDPGSPLMAKIKDKLLEVEDFARLEGDAFADLNDRDGLSDLSAFFQGSEGSPFIPGHSQRMSFKQAPASTPSRKFSEYQLPRANLTEIVEILNLHQNSYQLKTQQIVDQIRLIGDRVENLYFEQRSQRSLVEDLTTKFNRFENEFRTSISDLKKELKQRPADVYNIMDEEDYNDEALQFSNYLYSQRAPHTNTSMAYGASSFFSPRMEQLYPNNMPFYNQGGLTYNEGQAAADFLRSIPGTSQRASLPPNQSPLIQQMNMGIGSTPGFAMPGQLRSPGLGQGALRSPFAPTTLAPTNVVITTSDTLPTAPPPAQPALSVTIPPQYRQGAPHNFQITMPKEPEVAATPESITKVVETGTVLFEKSVSLFILVKPSEWKERGTGTLKVYKDENSDKLRIIMRKDGVMTVCANHQISNDTTIEPMNDKAWVWVASDSSEGTTKEDKFCARFKTTEDAQEFKRAFEGNKSEGKSLLKPAKLDISDPKSVKEDTPKTPMNVGGFKFTAPPKLKPTTELEAPKPAEEKKPESPFSKFSFSICSPNTKTKTTPSNDFAALAKQGGSFIKDNQPKPFSGTGSLIFKSPELNKSLDGSQNEDDFVPTEDFKPVIPLPELVEVKSGEENEEVLFEDRAKLLRFCADTKEWKERGIGKMKILKDPKTSSCRLVMRREQVLKVCCNQRITKDLVFKPNGPNAFTWAGKDFSEGTEQSEILAIKFKTAEQAAGFKKVVEDCQSTAVATPTKETQKPSSDKPSLASMFKAAPGQWECDGCFVRNKPEVTVCPACGTTKPGTTPQKSNDAVTFGDASKPFQFSFKHPGTESFFGAKTQAGATTTPPFTFGIPQTTTATTQPGGFSFFATTATAPTTFTFSSKPPPSLAPSQPSIFSKPEVTSPKKDVGDSGDEGGDEHLEEDEGDHIQFKPVIPLPDKIVVVSGEEDEEALYSQRAKLYRFDAKEKEWKERGLGDVKLLKHKLNGKVRILMRRNQVMKICLNHYVTQEINMRSHGTKAWRWTAMDFSSDEPTAEIFSIMFKNPEIAKEFMQAFNSAQLGAPAASPEKKAAPPSDNVKGSHLGNAPPAPSQKSSGDDELEIVYEKSVPEEYKAKAKALQLPPNFYNYLEAPPCPGCVGCDPDSDEDDKRGTKVGSQSRASVGFSLQQPRLQPLSEDLMKDPAAAEKLSDKTGWVGPLPGMKVFGDGGNSALPSGGLFNPTASPQFGAKGTLTAFGGFTPDKSTAADSARTPIFGGGTPPVFGTPKAPIISTVPSFGPTTTTTQIFGTPSVTAVQANTFGSTNLNDLPSFSSLAASEVKTDESPGGGFSFAALSQSRNIADSFKQGATPGFQFSSEPVFANLKKTSTPSHDKEEEDGEEDTSVDHGEPDPQFKPLIPLPDEVKLSTGEEDEDIVFISRAKLFRFDKNLREWKERGVGEMKLLKHRHAGAYRLLMRREQVYNIVCNHLIFSDLIMSPLSTSESSWCWVAMNLSQDETEPQLENLAIRFKNKEIATSFKKEVDVAIAEVVKAKANESASSFYSVIQDSRKETELVKFKVSAVISSPSGTRTCPDSIFSVIDEDLAIVLLRTSDGEELTTNLSSDDLSFKGNVIVWESQGKKVSCSLTTSDLESLQRILEIDISD